MRLTEFKNEYWWPLVESKLRECTLVGYESVWRNHIAEPLGDLELEELTPRKIDAWLESMPPKTARKSLAILRTTCTRKMRTWRSYRACGSGGRARSGVRRGS